MVTVYMKLDDDRLGGERDSVRMSQKDYGWKLLYDWLKHENRQYMSEITS